MKSLNLFLTVLFLFAFVFCQAVNVQTETIYFDFAKSKIKNSELKKLNQLKTANQFYLVGHTDSDGDLDYNQSLSKKRVNAVYNYLVSHNISKNKIEVEYFGEEKPLNENSDKKQKTENRRVEIRYISDPLLDYEVEAQIFDVNNNEETYYKGKDGTEIYIPANTFAEKDVKIELKEYYNTLDILCSNLSTHSNEQAIESSGMVHMKAFTEDGVEVEAQNKMMITFENSTGKTDFQYFEGERDENLQVNWQVDRSKPNRDWFTSDFFKNNFSNAAKKDIIVSWLNTKNDVKMFDWMKYFAPNEFIQPENLKCFKETEAKIVLDEFGNIIAVSMLTDTPMLKCDKLLEEGRRKLFDKGMKIDPEDYSLDFKVLDLTDKNRALLQDFKNATSLEQKDSLLAALEVVKQNSETVQFLTQKLGWINCDRFITDPNKIDYVVEVPSEMNIRMIVKEYNSYFNSYLVNGNQYKFRNIPEGKEVILICTKFNSEGGIEVAIEETTVQKTTFSDFKFEVVSREELKGRISRI